MDTPLDTLEQAKLEHFCRQNQIARLSVFGSVLTDRFSPNSDIDVLVTFVPGAPIGFLALGRLQRELSDLLTRDVDLVVEDGLKPAIRPTVLATAQVLYAAG